MAESRHGERVQLMSRRVQAMCDVAAVGLVPISAYAHKPASRVYYITYMLQTTTGYYRDH